MLIRHHYFTFSMWKNLYDHNILTPSNSTIVSDGGGLSIFSFSTGIKRGGYCTLISSTRSKIGKQYYLRTGLIICCLEIILSTLKE